MEETRQQGTLYSVDTAVRKRDAYLEVLGDLTGKRWVTYKGVAEASQQEATK